MHLGSDINNLNDSTFITKIKQNNENSFINKHIFEENIYTNRKNSDDENEETISKKLNLEEESHPQNLKASAESLFAYDNFEVGTTLNEGSLQFSIKENNYKENLNFNKTIYFSKNSKMQVKCEKCSKYFGVLKSEKNSKKICEKCSF